VEKESIVVKCYQVKKMGVCFIDEKAKGIETVKCSK